MSYQKNRKPQNASIPLSLVAGLTLAWAITLCVTIVVTVLVSGDRIAENAVKPGAVMAIFSAAFMSAMFVASKCESKKMVMCLGHGLLYMVSLLCCNALLFDGQFEGILGAVLTVIGGSMTAWLLQSRQKRHRPAYAKRYRS